MYQDANKHKLISLVLSQIPLNGKKRHFPYIETNIGRAQEGKRREIVGKWENRWGTGTAVGVGWGKWGPLIWRRNAKLVGVGRCGFNKAPPDFGKAWGREIETPPRHRAEVGLRVEEAGRVAVFGRKGRPLSWQEAARW